MPVSMLQVKRIRHSKRSIGCIFSTAFGGRISWAVKWPRSIQVIVWLLGQTWNAKYLSYTLLCSLKTTHINNFESPIIKNVVCFVVLLAQNTNYKVGKCFEIKWMLSNANSWTIELLKRDPWYHFHFWITGSVNLQRKGSMVSRWNTVIYGKEKLIFINS